MSAKFKINQRLLALTDLSEEQSINDWRPFPTGRTLNQILQNHNKKCFSSYKNSGWIEENIKKHGQGIDLVLHNLSTIGQLSSDNYKNIHIILLDIDSIRNRQSELNRVRYHLAQSNKYYFLTQVCTSEKKFSCKAFFAHHPIYLSTPEIMPNESSLENYLSTFCRMLRVANNAINALSKEQIKIIDDQGQRIEDPGLDEAITKISYKLRDAAVARSLSDDETVNLVKTAFLQEQCLSHIAEKIHSQTKDYVFIDYIREPFVDIKTDPLIDEVDFICLDMKKPFSELTYQEQENLYKLGLRGENYTAVHFDKQDILLRISGLESTLNINRFSAPLTNKEEKKCSWGIRGFSWDNRGFSWGDSGFSGGDGEFSGGNGGFSGGGGGLF